MAEFTPGVAIETAEPLIEVTVSRTNPLRIGRHRFRLVVVDDSGNQSLPDEVDVIVADQENPTAVLQAPRQVGFGQSFELSGAQSSDVGGGQIVRFIWTLIE
jgi:hypothetical protein